MFASYPAANLKAEFLTNTRSDGSRVYGQLETITYMKKIAELQKHATKPTTQ